MSTLSRLPIFVLAVAAALGAVRVVFPDRGETISYAGKGWMREGIQWDAQNGRFLVSMIEGGISQLRPDNGGFLKEKLLVDDCTGNSTLGIRLDPVRNRILAVISDPLGKKKFGGLAAYDLTTWNRLFLTKLEGPAETILADDVAVDSEGNSYVTDAVGNVVWKLNPDGALISTFNSPVFTSKKNILPFNIGLNGIVYHPHGYLLVVHTDSGALFKVSLDGSTVTIVQGLVLLGGDGIDLMSPELLVVAGIPGARMVQSNDGWKTARVKSTFVAPFYRLPTAVALKDGKAYLNLAFGWKSFRIKEAVF